MLGPKYFSSKKRFGSKKSVSKNGDPKNVDPKNCGSNKIFGPPKFGSKIKGDQKNLKKVLIYFYAWILDFVAENWPQ